MGDLIPAAKSAGVSVEQLGASYAILTASGIKAAPASTMMKNLFAELSATGSETDKILRQIAGGSFVELMRQGKSVGDVLQILSQHAEKSGLTLKDLFSSSEAGDAALALMKDGADGFNQSLAEMENSAGTCDKAFQQLNETTSKKLERAFNAVKNAMSDVGQAISPLVGDIADLVENVANAASEFANAHPNITTFGVALGGLAAAAGPVLLVLGSIISKVPDLVKGFNDIKKGAGFIKGFFSTASLAANGPLLAIGAVTLGVVGLAKAYKDNEEEIKQSFDQWCEDVDTKAAETWNSVKESVLEFGQAAADGLANGVEAIIGIFTTTGEFISQLFSSIWTGLTTSVSTVFTTIGTVFSTGWEFVKTTTSTAWENIKTTVSTAWTNITTDISTKITNIKTTVSNAWNNVKTNTLNAWNNVKTSISNAVSNAKTTVTNGWNNIKTATTNAWNNIKTAISNAWTNIKTACSNAVNNVKTSVTNGFNQLKSITQNAWNNVVSAIKTAWTNIKTAVTNGASRVVDACSSAFSRVKDILTAPFKAARDTISGILGGIKDKISSIASFGRGRSMQAMEVAMPYRISTYVESVQENAPMLFARGGGIVGDLEGVQQLIERTFPNNGEDLIKKFAEAGKEAGEKYVEELRKLEPLVTESINRMAATIENRTRVMSNMAITTFAAMTSRIIAYMSSLCASTISYWNQMRATLGQTIRGEIIVTHRDIYIEERKSSGGGKGGATGGKKMLAQMFAIPQTDTMQTLALLNTDAAAIRFRDMQSGGSSNTRSKKGDIIDYDKLGKAIAKYQKGDVKIENTYNSPKPASIKELKQQDEILLRRLKKQKRI